MSSTAYHTSAKPRGRRGSYGDAAEKQTRSRASSAASMKLSKTVSRTLDEVSAPRNSRPDSPASYIHRQRTLDSTSSGPTIASWKHSMNSLKSEKVVSPSEDERRYFPESSTKQKPRPVQYFQDDGRGPHIFLSEPDHSPRKTSNPIPVEAYEIRSAAPAPKRPERPPISQEYSRKTDLSMQPTVAEESEDINATTNNTRSIPSGPLTSPGSFPAAAPSIRDSKASIHEWVPLGSPRSSQQSLVDCIHPKMTGMASPYFHDPLVAPAPKGSITFLRPSSNQHPLEASEGELSVPIMSSSWLSADGKALDDDMSNARSPLASPPGSPFLHQHLSSPPSQQPLYPPPYPFPYPPGFLNNPPFPPGFYPPPFTSPTTPFSFPEAVPRAGSAGIEDERAKLLEKVSNVLPDINRLLHYYQESQGLLSEKDLLVREAESQHSEEVARLRIELGASKEEYERIIGDQASENVKLKGDVAELSERFSLLEGSTHTAVEVNEELSTLKLKSKSIESEVEQGRLLNEQLSAEKQALEDELANLKNKVTDDGAQYDSTIEELRRVYDRQMVEKEEDHHRILQDHKVGLSKIQLDLAGMITKHTQQRKDLDLARSTVAELEHSLAVKAREQEDTVREYERELEARRKAAEETAEQHTQQMALMSQELAQTIVKHGEEVEAVRECHQQELEQVRSAAAKQLADLASEYDEREAQLQMDLKTTSSEAEAQRSAHSTLKRELESTREAHETLKQRNEMSNKHHVQLVESMSSLRTKQAEWQRETERIDQILQSLGDLGSSTIGNTTSSNRGQGDEFL